MIYVYSEHITNRLQYIVEYFSSIIGIHFTLIHNIEKFEEYSGPKINYSTNTFKTSLQIEPTSLLFEKTINEQNILVEQKEYPIFFQTKGDMPFDIFAASFYLISRYEEYLPHKKDVHNRFPASNSLAFKYNFLHIPIVDIWVMELKQLLNKKYHDLNFNEKKYQYIPTIDVDVPYYAFYTKGIIRGFLNIFKSISIFDFKELKLQWNILTGKIQDPFDTYDKLFEIHNKYNVKSIFFIQAGKYGKYDKNIPVKSRRFEILVDKIKQHSEIGIHPSYQSNSKDVMIIDEINILYKLTKTQITKSRQHYLMLKLPDTYRNLINAGIQEDFSMGYAEEIGFRAGTCTPFYYYDLEKEEKTNLKIIPFAIMDGTLNEYKKYTINEAKEVIIKTIDEVKKVKGTFISIWHNSSFNKNNYWKDWQELYISMIKYNNQD